ALSAEFTIGEGELMAHDVPLGCAPDEYDDLISGTCSHLPYDTLARLRVVLSDREAWGYLSIGLLVSALFSMTIIRMSMESGINAGHIYSVMTYMWMFATSLDDAPQLLEKFSQLRDIGKRVSTDDETSLSGKPC
ncbi:ABC transporter six-transmembrane domain-containing protein, partial [Klebsiella pneumoniae]|uniref:ABC transporter six-transmembrane domain-containing protein n=1 Tax=Klebsiella pneumoniae TaxID=573 RepID=UPI001D181D1E